MDRSTALIVGEESDEETYIGTIFFFNKITTKNVSDANQFLNIFLIRHLKFATANFPMSSILNGLSSLCFDIV
jgi:hypothetical protein